MSKKVKIMSGVIVLLAVAAVVYAISVKPSPKKAEIDIVNGIEAVHQWDSLHYLTMDTLAHIPDGQKMAFIKAHWPTLANDVVANVRGFLPLESRVDSVVFMYGSGKATANDKRLQKFKGKFENQLIAAIYLQADKKSPYLFFVRCLNGMSDPVEATINRIGTQNPDFEFTISRTEGLCHHVDYLTSVSLSRNFGLPLYRGKKISAKNRITYDEALRLSRRTNRVQVTVLVYTGDHFNLRDMTYNGRH